MFERDWWASYQRVNAAFADAPPWPPCAASPTRSCGCTTTTCMLVPLLVRQLLPDQPIGFFLHVPWPSPDLFMRMPWRADVLRGLLGADVVSFHTEGYRRNFVQACTRLLGAEGVTLRPGRRGGAARRAGGAHHGLADLHRRRRVHRRWPTRRRPTSRWPPSSAQFAGRKVLLGVDRLDYTKGIVERLLAVELLLERREDLRT